MSFAGFIAVIVIMLLAMFALGIGGKGRSGNWSSCLLVLLVLVCAPVIFGYVVMKVNSLVSKPVQRDFWVLMHGMKLRGAEPLSKAADVKEGAERTAAKDQQLRNQCLAMVTHFGNVGDKTSACINDARAGGTKYETCLTGVIKQYGDAFQSIQADSCRTNPQQEIDELVAGTAASTICGPLVRVNALIDLFNRIPFVSAKIPFFSQCPLPDESVVQ